MNDRFKFRLPFYNNNGEFSHFQYIDIVDGLKPYNAGVMFHRDEYEQCTSLRDKNGNLMYAGDRVRAIMPDSRPIGETAGYSEYTKETTGIIKWNDRCAGFVIEDTNEDLVFFYEIADSEDIEIIGNIHTQKDNK